MARLLAAAMRRPLDEMPRRPQTLRIRRRYEWQELLPHLRQLGVQVVSAPRLATSDNAVVFLTPLYCLFPGCYDVQWQH